MFWRSVSVVWIAVTLVINVFALTALLDAWEIVDTAWKPELHLLGRLYAVPVFMLADVLNGPVQALLTTFLPDEFTLPCWWVHLLAIYAASASAIWAGTMSRDERNNRIGELTRGGSSIFFPLALIGYLGQLVVQGFRNRIVSRFLAVHTNTAITYAVAVVGLYVAANLANKHLIEGHPHPDQEWALENASPCEIDSLREAVDAASGAGTGTAD